MLHSHDVADPEPRWPAMLAVLAAVALHFSLPPQLRFGRPGLGAAVVVILLLIANGARLLHARRINELAGWAILIVLAGGLLYGVGALVAGLVAHSVPAPDLLRAAAVLWAANGLVFAIWYWRVDAGGPNERERRQAHTSGAFLFPQMAAPAADGSGRTIAEAEGWHPGFVDYLFLAFVTSTAFSPTDVLVLSRWGKGAMMIQATIAFTTVVLIVGRGVNIL
jgi:hypothetical protein